MNYHEKVRLFSAIDFDNPWTWFVVAVGFASCAIIVEPGRLALLCGLWCGASIIVALLKADG